MRVFVNDGVGGDLRNKACFDLRAYRFVSMPHYGHGRIHRKAKKTLVSQGQVASGIQSESAIAQMCYIKFIT